MINYLIHANLCIAVFYLLYFIFLRDESFYRLNRFYILVSILLSLIIPVAAPYFYHVVDVGTYAIFLPEITISTTSSGPIKVQESSDGFNWIIIINIIYFAGTVFSLSVVFMALGSLMSIIYKGIKTSMENYTLVRTKAEISIFSFFHYVVVPASVTEIHPHIIRHELVHIRKYHTLDLIFLELVKVLCWFNPFIYAFIREIKSVHEYEADTAFKNGEEVNNYIHLLLDGLENRLVSSGLSNHFYNSLIKKRIDMLHKKESSISRRWKYLILVPVAIFLISNVQSRDMNPMEKPMITTQSLTLDTIPSSPPAPPTPPAPTPPKSSEKKDMEIFKIVEEMPRFPGCEDMEGSNVEKENCSKQKMIEFIYYNLKYPEAARLNKTEGTAVVQFIINKNGTLEDIEIVRDPGDGCGAAAFDAILAMNEKNIRWKPGKQRGNNVNVLYTLPVKFKLEDE